MSLKILLLIGLALLLTACCPQEELDERGWPKELVLGLVPALEVETLIDNLEPLTDHLERELGVRVRSFVPMDYTGLVEAMGSGRADIGMLPPFSAVLANQRYDIETILVSTRQGEIGYPAMWFTNDPSICETEVRFVDHVCRTRGRTDGPVVKLGFCEASLEVVRGHTVGFVQPTSTSGFLFPGMQLRELGMDLERDINAMFIGRHDGTPLAVARGDTRFGVAFLDIRERMCEQHPDIGERAIVFNYTPLIPNDGVQVRPGLPPDLREAIKQAFLNLIESQAHLPRDEQVLYVLYEIDGFMSKPDGFFDPVERAAELLREQ